MSMKYILKKIYFYLSSLFNSKILEKKKESRYKRVIIKN